MAARLYVQLRSKTDETRCWATRRRSSTPRLQAAPTSASDVFFDDFAGTDSDARRGLLIRILGDAAEGRDVQLRASTAGRHRQPPCREFHEVDALAAEGFLEHGRQEEDRR